MEASPLKGAIVREVGFWHLANYRATALVCPLADQSGHRTLLGSGSLQSFLKTAEQLVVIEWLAQEGKRSSLHGTRLHVLLGISRNENDGDAMTSGGQPVLQVKTA